MLSRRHFLTRTLQGSSLVALNAMVPQFVARTAQAAAPGKDNILVVLELSGGNDGLNTVIPYADDLYHKARPTLRQTKDVVVRLDDHIGLNSGMQGFRPMWEQGHLAVVQGVGYPNPERSHFEAMDIWQSADPENRAGTGWLGRSIGQLHVPQGKIGGMHVGGGDLPLALQGSPLGIPSVQPGKPYDLRLGGNDKERAAQRKLIQDLTAKPADDGGDMLRVVADVEDAAVDLGMEGLDATVEHLGEAGEVGDVADGEAGFAEGFGGAAGGDEFDVVGGEGAGEVDEACFVGDGEEGAADGL